MMYTSEEEEKGRVQRGRGKEREEGKHNRMARGCHGFFKVSLGLPMYALRADTPEKASWPFQGWPPAERATCGRLITLLNTLKKYASGEWGRESKERDVKKGKRKGKGGGERMGVW
jgi:hypothetical protein